MHMRLTWIGASLTLLVACSPTAPSMPGSVESVQTEIPQLLTAIDEGPESGRDACQERILVRVWSDVNEDGQQDPGEPPLSDAGIVLNPPDDVDQSVIRTNSDNNGETTFSAHDLRDCDPHGYTVRIVREAPGHALPAETAVTLDDFDMANDVVGFGLPPIPLSLEDIQISARPVSRQERILEAVPGQTLDFSALSGDELSGLAVPVDVTWRVEPEGAAVINAEGVLTVDSGAAHDTILTVTAETAVGDLSTEVYVYDPQQNPFVGEWYEVQRLDCPDAAAQGGEYIGEVLFLANYQVYVTGMPFEVYFDYWAQYSFQMSDGSIEIDHVDEINDFPTEFDGQGTFEFDDEGRLILREIWLGGLLALDSPGAACGHVLERR